MSVRVYACEHPTAGSTPNGPAILRKEQFTTDDALRAVMVEAGHWNAAELERRQALGDVCYLVLEGPRCVHYTWVTRRFRSNTEIGFEATPDENNPWIYNSYTSPSHRGRSLYTQVIGKIAEDVQKRNGQRTWIDVQDENTPSVRGVTKAGFAGVAVFKKKVLFSSMVFDRRIIPVSAELEKEFNRMSPQWI